MNRLSKKLGAPLAASVLLVFAASTLWAGDEEIGDRLRKASEGSHRAEGHRDRNVYRNPVETLEFFGLAPDMTVVEISPGRSGWYTEILAPVLREKGRLVVAGYDKDSENERQRGAWESFNEKLKAHPEVYDKVAQGVCARGKLDFGPEGSADMVLTFRNVHNWMPGMVTEVFQEAYKVLKPGGVFGVVEHRADPGTPMAARSGNGYVHQDYVIKLAEAAGFILIASSEINANPKDTKDYSSGVWTLPPVLTKKEEDREKYLAIGESDRMTLKFVKP